MTLIYVQSGERRLIAKPENALNGGEGGGEASGHSFTDTDANTIYGVGRQTTLTTQWC